MRITTPEQLDDYRKQFRRLNRKVERQIRICAGAGCLASGAATLRDEFVKALADSGLNGEVVFSRCTGTASEVLVGETGCQGLCQAGPLVTLQPGNLLYCGVKPRHISRIVIDTIIAGKVIPELLYRNPDNGETCPTRTEIPFYARQKPVVLEGCGTVFSDSLEHYLATDGFAGLEKALTMDPVAIVDEIEKSGLRGKGGGGFPTGRKWRTCVNADGSERYIVCNGDEGDPGAFMDCALMEGDSYRVIEGMIIGAHAIGAGQGFIYVRHEYPRAVRRLDHAVNQCREWGILGDGILGSSLSFDIRIVRGGGAFVCGESSALMRSIEGYTGEPRSKYIRSTEKGLFDCPTVLNNVETFASVAAILRDGAFAFASVGTDRSKGTKAFCLAGKVKYTGLVEVPMGTTLREVIVGIGGGVRDGRSFKAVQTGGPSGGCLGEAHLDLRVDFDELQRAGSMMGSGGMIVLDDYSCMVDVTRYFLKFLMDESCGKCVSCREGIFQMYQIVDAIASGNGTRKDLDRIEQLAGAIATGSLCGLGKSAPNPVMSAIEGFRDEFEAHIIRKKCPAGVCPALTTFAIRAPHCTGCMKCRQVCPVDAISGERKQTHRIDPGVCTRCGACRLECDENAIVAM